MHNESHGGSVPLRALGHATEITFLRASRSNLFPVIARRSVEACKPQISETMGWAIEFETLLGCRTPWGGTLSLISFFRSSQTSDLLRALIRAFESRTLFQIAGYMETACC
jgi:hypothetical protein